jgi:thioredoxin-related protein
MRTVLGLGLALACLALPAAVLRAGDGAPAKTRVAGPTARAPRVEWVEYGAALNRARQENKHLIIDFYTDWCGWCKRMDRDTYGDSTVASYLNAHFIVSKVNAESPQRFKVGDKTVSGIELARDFAVKGFPITWFIRPNGERIDGLPGYHPPAKFQKVLEFVHERRYEKSQ